MMEVTDKQRRFAEEYIIDLNATQAAIRAGYSAKTAHSQGPRLLDNVGVAALISDLLAKRSQRTEITADRVLEEWARLAFSDIADVTNWGVKEVAIGFDADGKRLRPEDIGDAAVVRYVEAPFVTPVNRDDLPEHLRAAVAEVSLGREGFRIKMHDKLGALAKLGDHLGLAPKRAELSGPNGGPIETTTLTDDLAKLPAEKRAELREAIRGVLEREG